MSGLIPIPTSRITGLFSRQRLTQQLQADQLDLFRIQDQISTGQRIILPSDDAPSALRSISLQRLLERKTQLSKSVNTGLEFLAATDTTLGSGADLLFDVKAATLEVVGTVTTAEQRDSAIAKINSTLEQLLTTANTKYRDRYLFSGTQTNQVPYELTDRGVVYHGDEGSVQTYSDINVLFDTNANGQEVFGGLSAAVEGSVDLNPQLSEDTLLSSLRGGAGIDSNGAFTISDGFDIRTIDIGGAVTVGDVKRLIELNVPTGREITVTITGSGIDLQFDPSNSDNTDANLIVEEVGTGRTARGLGIFTENGVGTALSVGEDIDPVLRSTTQLGDILGTKARAVVVGDNGNNDIQLVANANGTALDGVTVQFVDDDLLTATPGLVAGNEVAEYDANARAASASLSFAGTGDDLIVTANTSGTAFNNVAINVVSGGDIGDAASAVYDSGAGTLTITVDDDGETTIQTVVDEIANTGQFTATHDTSVEAAFDPAITVTGGASGNTGNSGGEAKTLYVRIDRGDTTANEVITAINAEGSFTASLDPNDSTTLSDAGTGVVNLSATATTAGGSGSTLDLDSGIQIVNGGETHEITFEDAETINDLLNILNGSAAGVFADINANGNGIDIRSRVSGTDFQIGENGGSTASQLGVRSYNSDTKLSDLNFGRGVSTFGGFDLPTTTGDDLVISTIDGQSFGIDLSGAESVTEVVDAINAVTGLSVTASEVTTGNVSVLQLVDNSVAGTDSFSVSQSDGSLAAQYLGIIPGNEGTQITTGGTTLLGDDANYIDLQITATDGQTYSVDLSNAESVGDAIDEFNSALAGAGVLARLAVNGNGIELIDTNAGPGDLTLQAAEGSTAAEDLGLPTESTGATALGTLLTSEDRNFYETDSVFTSLIRLRDALEENNAEDISRAAAKLDVDIDRLVFTRSAVGAQEQALEISQQSLQGEDIQLRTALSEELDVDLVQAISDLTARQISLQASLQATANLLQLSLLNFI